MLINGRFTMNNFKNHILILSPLYPSEMGLERNMIFSTFLCNFFFFFFF